MNLSMSLEFETKEQKSQYYDQYNSIMQDESLNKAKKIIFEMKARRTMKRSSYFIVKDRKPEKWGHFDLGFPVYTHFTSPIRRYPDVLVHRLLTECLKES